LQALQNTAIAALRTAFPAAWAAGALWLSGRIPMLHDVLEQDWVKVAVLAVITYGVRYLFGFIEKRKWVPDWVAVILLGSAKRPVYLAPVVADAVNDGQAVSVVAERQAP
jgi:hypothetical protein